MGKGMAARTGFNPADYTLVGHFYKGDSDVVAATYREDHRELETLLGEDFWDVITIGGCGSCGTSYFHGTVVQGPGGEYFSVGQICGSEYFGLDTVYALRTKEAKAAEERNSIKAMAAGVLDSNPGLAEALETDHSITHDLKRKLDRYGDLTIRQIELAYKLQREAAERAEAVANEPPAVPVIEGKYTVTGKVLSYRWQESHFAYNAGAWKMLVLVTTDDGTFKLWGTIPSKLVGSVQKGTVVRFNATVEKSDKDESFGFYSRPTKAEVIEGGRE